MNEDLVNRIRQCPNLPSLPSVAIQVLELAQQANADITEIARVISKDAALSSKILRTVNSSFYARSQAVSTISHALVILGLQSVKTLVLGFSLVSNLSRNKSKGFHHIDYWRRSIYSATAARSLAAKVSLLQQEEAFLAALLSDLGMLVLDSVLGDQYGELCGKAANHSELVVMETESLKMTHADVGGLLTEQWKLPPLLSVPIKFSHRAKEVEDASLRKLTETIQAAGRCADVFIDKEPAQAIADVRAMCQSQHNINEADCDALLAEIGKRTKEVASLFEINIGAAMNFETILKKANEALIEITLQSQQQASTLQQQNDELKQRATTDGLTGLSNRAAFDQFLAERFATLKTQKDGGSMALLMLDLDKFKSINDMHGHQAGDQVLQHVAKILLAAARKQDLPARYGGEELALILPDTTRATAAAIAETIRRAIAHRPIKTDKQPIPVTASIGVAVYDPPTSPFREPAHLLKAADLSVYNAKHSGRNCVRVFSIKGPATSAPPATSAAAPPLKAAG